MLSGRRYHCPSCGGELRGEKSFFSGFTYTCLRCGRKAGENEVVAGQAPADAHRKREWDSKAGERKKQADIAKAVTAQTEQATALRSSKSVDAAAFYAQVVERVARGL